MRIALVSICAPPMDLIGDLSFPNKEAYCRQHGYDFHGVRENPAAFAGRHPSWGKIPLLLSLLDDYDVLFWTDCDSVIANASIRVESILAENPGADLYIAEDQISLNAGEFLIRSTPGARQFLSDVWDEFPVAGPWWEQSAMITLLERRPDRIAVEYLDKRLINSYPFDYRCGDFVIHWPGDPSRVPKMKSRLMAIGMGIGIL